MAIDKSEETKRVKSKEVDYNIDKEEWDSFMRHQLEERQREYEHNKKRMEDLDHSKPKIYPRIRNIGPGTKLLRGDE